MLRQPNPRPNAPGKKKRHAFRAYGEHRKPGDAHTILSFCRSNTISESFYYVLKRQGKNPREIELNGRIIITPQAEEDWRREREAETMAKRRAKQQQINNEQLNEE